MTDPELQNQEMHKWIAAHPESTAIERLMHMAQTREEAEETMAGIERGLADWKAGRVKNWEEVKKELGL